MSDSSLDATLKRLTIDPTYGAYLAVAAALERPMLPATQRPKLKLAILRNFTVEAVLPVVKGEIALSGFDPEIHLGDHDTIMQSVLDPDDALYAFQPDVVIVAQWLDALAPALCCRFPSMSAEQVDDEIRRVVVTTAESVAALRRHTRAPILVNNFPLPAFPAAGILDAQTEGSQTQSLVRLNLELMRHLRSITDVYIVDLMTMVGRLGRLQAIDERYWQIGRAPLGRRLLVALGQEVGKFVRALVGKTRKCLVLDCDNVLWGGVVGEEGLDGIELASAYPGSRYQAFQQEILNLHDRGVLLALCSKNNEADVVEVLRHHPDMLLHEEHFAARQINWDDKATNLARLAQTLNIGLDSLVFADDSAFECDLVRQQLPDVAVLQLSADPSSYAARLNASGYFDTLTVSSEDRDRNRMYDADKHRRALAATASSLHEYLASLEMVADIAPVDGQSLARAAQLTQKTNQFNLTTQRYTEGDIRAFADRPDADVVTMRLTDRVAALGIIGLAIVLYEDNRAAIDTFLLSCRALGRGAEQAMLAHLCAAARRRGCTRIVGRYVATKKNGQVAGFYQQNGFTLVAGQHDDSVWERPLDGADVGSPEWIRVAGATTSGERSVHAE